MPVASGRLAQSTGPSPAGHGTGVRKGAGMKIQVFPDADTVAQAGRQGWWPRPPEPPPTERGRFVMAVSGGHTPWQMLRALAHEIVPWPAVHVFQVDERVAPTGDPDRNLTHLRESLLSHAPLDESQIHAMPVNDPDLPAAAAHYATTLLGVAGMPAVFDLIHLGLGPDGHTASLVPGDPVLDSHRLRRGDHRRLSRPPADDADLSGAQPRPQRLLAGDRRIEGRHAGPAGATPIRRFRPAASTASMPICWPTSRQPRSSKKCRNFECFSSECNCCQHQPEPAREA